MLNPLSAQWSHDRGGPSSRGRAPGRRAGNSHSYKPRTIHPWVRFRRAHRSGAVSAPIPDPHTGTSDSVPAARRLGRSKPSDSDRQERLGRGPLRRQTRIRFTPWSVNWFVVRPSGHPTMLWTIHPWVGFHDLHGKGESGQRDYRS